jgi:hypothetical protein
MTEQLISDYAELSEEEASYDPQRSTPIWKLVVIFLTIAFIMIVISVALCLTHAQCRTNLPTLHTLLTEPMTSPYVVIAGVALAGVHCVISLGIFYRTRVKSTGLATMSMAFSVLLYISLAVALFIFPATGWNGDWGNLASVAVMFVWMLFAQLALRRVYLDRIQSERKWLRFSLAMIIIYAASSVAYIVVRAIPASIFPDPLAREIGLLVTEAVFGVSVIAFMIVTLVHTKNVRYTCFYKRN